MTSVTRADVVLVFVSLFVVVASWYIWMDVNMRLRMELAEVEKRFEQISEEHERTMAAATQAIRARNEINDIFCQRNRALEKALAHPDLALPVPESLFLCLQPEENIPIPAPAAGAAGSNPPAGPLGHKDNG